MYGYTVAHIQVAYIVFLEEQYMHTFPFFHLIIWVV